MGNRDGNTWTVRSSTLSYASCVNDLIAGDAVAVPTAAAGRAGPVEREIDGSWQRREPALPAVAVVGVGAVAASLAAAAHARLRDGADLRAVADPEYLLILGAEDTLPWADGARYLGWDGRALTLTTHRVLPAADLWRDAALAEDGGDPASLVVVLPEQILVSAMPARPADPDALAKVFAI